MRTIALVIVLARAAVPLRAQDHPPPIAGTWKLDSAKSDRPNAPPMGPQRGMPPGERPGRDGPPGGMPRGGGRDGPPAWGGYGAGESDPMVVMALMRPPLELAIVESDATWTIKPERAARQVLTPGGSARVDTLLNGIELVTKARWKQDRLVVERDFKGLAKVKETYGLDPQTGELVVDVTVAPNRFSRTVELRRVYDRVDDR